MAKVELSIFVMLDNPARASEPLLLDVVINNYPIGKIGEFTLRDDALFATPGELRDLGFRVPDSVRQGTDGLVALSALPGVTARLDKASQTMHVTAPAASLLPTLLPIATGPDRRVPVESGKGVTLDYDIVDTYLSGGNLVSGLFNPRVFSPWGVLSSGLLARAGRLPYSQTIEPAIRLDTTATYSDVDQLRRYRVGDVISGGLTWTRPVRLGGAQIATDFSLRPDLVTFPVPIVAGSVAVPSSVDVLVNNVRVLSREVQPGPFQIPQLPVVTGAGNVTMTVTNALGRQVTTTLPFYASSALLNEGLQSYSLEIGSVRLNWGIVSDDYHSLVGAARYRRGLSSVLTGEAHAEGGPGVAMAGAGAAFTIGDYGVFNLAASGNTGSGAGAQVSAGAQHLGPVFSLGGTAIATTKGYKDVAAINGDPTPRLQLAVNGGLSLGRFGSVSAAFVSIDLNALPPPLQTIFPITGSFTTGTTSLLAPTQRARIATASYSVQLGNVSAYATGYRNLIGDRSSGVVVGLTVPLGSRSSAGVSASSATDSHYAQVNASQSVVSIGDWGYQFYGAAGQQPHQFGQLLYKSPWGLASGGIDRTNGRATLQAEALGAVSYVDGGLYFSNAINDAFAIVDTNGVPGVRVLSENREVGRTGSDGRLLVPDLRSYDINHLAIEPNDVPLDTAVPVASREVRPQDRSGVLVEFPLRASRGALLRLMDNSGKPIPLGSTATAQPGGTTAPVGYDGETFIENLDEIRDRGRASQRATLYRLGRLSADARRDPDPWSADLPGGSVTKRLAILIGLLTLAPVAARAACTVSANLLAFGVYPPFSGTPTDSTGEVRVQCSSGFTGLYTIALNAGLNSGGSFANRQMASGANRLSYQLYRDAARTSVWGDGTGGTEYCLHPLHQQLQRQSDRVRACAGIAARGARRLCRYGHSDGYLLKAF